MLGTRSEQRKGAGGGVGAVSYETGCSETGEPASDGLGKVFTLWVSDVTTVKEKTELNRRFLNLTKEVHFVLFSFFTYRVSGSPIDSSYQTMRDPGPRNLHC